MTRQRDRASQRGFFTITQIVAMGVVILLVTTFGLFIAHQFRGQQQQSASAVSDSSASNYITRVQSDIAFSQALVTSTTLDLPSATDLVLASGAGTGYDYIRYYLDATAKTIVRESCTGCDPGTGNQYPTSTSAADAMWNAALASGIATQATVVRNVDTTVPPFSYRDAQGAVGDPQGTTGWNSTSNDTAYRTAPAIDGNAATLVYINYATLAPKTAPDAVHATSERMAGNELLPVALSHDQSGVQLNFIPPTPTAATAPITDDFTSGSGSAASPNTSNASGQIGVTQDGAHYTWLNLASPAGQTQAGWSRLATCDATYATATSCASGVTTSPLVVQAGLSDVQSVVTPTGGFNVNGGGAGYCTSAGTTLTWSTKPADASVTIANDLGVRSCASAPAAATAPDASFQDGEAAYVLVSDPDNWVRARLVGTATAPVADGWVTPVNVTYTYTAANSDCPIQINSSGTRTTGTANNEKEATADCTATEQEEWYYASATGYYLVKSPAIVPAGSSGCPGSTACSTFDYFNAAGQRASLDTSGNVTGWVSDDTPLVDALNGANGNGQNTLFSDWGSIDAGKMANCTQANSIGGYPNTARGWVAAPGFSGTNFTSNYAGAVNGACGSINSDLSGQGGYNSAIGKSIPMSFLTGDKSYSLGAFYWPASFGSNPASVNRTSMVNSEVTEFGTSNLSSTNWVGTRRLIAAYGAAAGYAGLGNPTSGTKTTDVYPSYGSTTSWWAAFATRPCTFTAPSHYRLISCVNDNASSPAHAETWKGTIYVPSNAAGTPITALPSATGLSYATGTPVPVHYSAPSYVWKVVLEKDVNGTVTMLGTYNVPSTAAGTNGSQPAPFGVRAKDDVLNIVYAGALPSFLDAGNHTVASVSDSFNDQATMAGIGYGTGNSPSTHGIDAVRIEKE